MSTQLLHQIQASPHSISEGIPSVTNMQKAQNSAEGSIRGNWHSVGRSKGSPDPKASSKADFRKAAHLLEKRQEDILRRLTCLEEDQAQRREVSAGSKPEACLKWQILTPKLLVRSVATVHAVQAHCVMLPCTLQVERSNMQSCTALKRSDPCCFVTVFIIGLEHSVHSESCALSKSLWCLKHCPSHPLMPKALFLPLPKLLGACQIAARRFVVFTTA